MERTYDPLAADVGLAFNASRPKAAASWGAIIAGAFVAIAVTLILFALGSGLGFASVSPWADRGVGATTFTIAAAIWLIVMQWISAALGGYIAGRLRTRWIGTHVHEIFFRDTAHGLVTWAVATVVVAALVASTVSSGVSGGLHAASSVVAGSAQGAMQGAAGSAGGPGSSSWGYGVDKLFRTNTVAAGTSAMGASGPVGMPGDARGNDPRMEAGRIMANALATGAVPDADRTYLASLVAQRTGVSEADAQKRVNDFVASAQETEAKVKAEADAARKAAAEVAIYTALSMLIGAFIASDGLALSSRNVHLDPAERMVAAQLNRVLADTAARLHRGESITDAEAAGKAALRQAGFTAIDYVAVRDAQTLQTITGLEKPARVLAAARVGRTRLIDTMPV